MILWDFKNKKPLEPDVMNIIYLTKLESAKTIVYHMESQMKKVSYIAYPKCTKKKRKARKKLPEL